MFFALPEFSTKDGRVVNATFGMAKFFVGQLKKEKPDYVVFIKDAKGKNFRHELYAEYKATRERMPDSLRSQIGDIEEMIARMWIDIIEIPWFEADDVIGTLAVRLAKQSQNEIYILSWDKDLYALVNEQVKIYDTQRKKISGPEETFEKFGIPAACVRDYLAICGDSSDNIPGIAGIWPKKAQVLLNEFWTLEKIYEIVDDIENLRENISEESQKVLRWKALEKFIEWKELAFLSQKLATLDCDMELSDFDLDDYAFDESEIETPQLIDFFKELEFFSIIPQDEIQKENWQSQWKKVKIIWDEQWLRDLELDIYSNYKEIVIDTETTSLNVREAQLVWISILLSENKIYYINLMHNWPRVNYEMTQNFVKKLLWSDIKLIAHNFKYDLQIFEHFMTKTQGKTKKSWAEDLWQMQLGL
jgi:DNA polymerase-1